MEQQEFLKEGDFHCFRAADADQHDPEGLQFYSGVVMGVEWDDCMGERMYAPSYRVVCTDGSEQSFMDTERYYPNAFIDPAGKWHPGSFPQPTH